MSPYSSICLAYAEPSAIDSSFIKGRKSSLEHGATFRFFERKAKSTLSKIVSTSDTQKVQLCVQILPVWVIIINNTFAEIQKRAPKIVENSQFDDCTVETLQTELTNFATHWKKLNMSTLDSNSSKNVKDISGEGTNLPGADEDLELVSSICSTCKNCVICYHKYNLLIDSYHVIELSYTFLLPMSVTQIDCERHLSL